MSKAVVDYKKMAIRDVSESEAYRKNLMKKILILNEETKSISAKTAKLETFRFLKDPTYTPPPLDELKLNQPLFQDEVLRQYQSLTKHVRENIKKFSIESRRGYCLKSKKNFAKLTEILRQQAGKCQIDALKTLGFIHTYGIGVRQNKRVAFDYFQKCALEGDMAANYACYCLSETPEQAYHFFGVGL